MPPKKSVGGGSPTKAAGSHASRAAALLSKARAAAAASSSASSSTSSSSSNSSSITTLSSSSPTKKNVVYQRTLNAPSSSSSSNSNGVTPTPTTGAGKQDLDTSPIPLPDLLKTLSTKGGIPLRDAMSVAAKLINARANTQAALHHVSLIMLQDIGIQSEELRKRTVLAFKGKKAAGIIPTSSSSCSGTNATASAGGDSAMGSKRQVAPGLAPDFLPSSPRKRRRKVPEDDETLSREYGNVRAPDESSSSSSSLLRRRAKAIETEYIFNENLSIDQLRGRYAIVNRAPVVTAWAVLLLERLGFTRPESLSLAHCYVAYTSTKRGISLGILASNSLTKQVNQVGTNQPHFELMGVNIPVMLMGDGSYRGISNGEVVAPEKAYYYMKKSMAQTLPSVMGALTLLADSFMEPPPPNSSSQPATPAQPIPEASSNPPIKSESESPEKGVGTSVESSQDAASSTDTYGAAYLNTIGYELYASFRPSTSGEWGKKGTLWYDKILALRRGHEEELEEWVRNESTRESNGGGDEEFAQDLERLVQEEMLLQQQHEEEEERAATG